MRSPAAFRLAAACLALALALPAAAQLPGPAPGPLRELGTADAGRGWDGVGRLELGGRGFCTGALIEPALVLTAAHCLHDRETGRRFDAAEITFLAGWRNGRAAAYRGVRRAVAHPAYVFGGAVSLEAVSRDIALLELDQPIRLPSIRPFDIDFEARAGDRVGVVSYARGRAETPSLQELCHVLARESGALVLSCLVDFGASGAPIFSMNHGVPRVVSVVSAKAHLQARPVALGTGLREQLSVLRQALGASGDVRFQRPSELAAPPVAPAPPVVERDNIGARFVRP